MDEGYEKMKLWAAMKRDIFMTLYAGGKDVDHIRAKFFKTLKNANILKNES